MLRITDSLVLDEREIEEHFSRASGPGGQNVNKLETAVELRLNLAGSSLPDPLKARLIRLAGHRMTTEGVLVIHSREHRTQGRNREAARTRLLDLLRLAARPPRIRRKTKVSVRQKQTRLSTKRQRGDQKKTRKKVAGED